MGYSLSATFGARLDFREQADATTSPASSAGGNQRSYDQYSLDLNLNSASFPPLGGQVVDLSFTLTGTTKDFDLTAAPWAGAVTSTIDKSTKKLVALILRFAKTNNAAGVAFGPQGANGYALWGAGQVPVFYPGTQLVLGLVDPDQVALTLNTPAVAAGAKDLRFTGAVGDTWKCLLGFNG